MLEEPVIGQVYLHLKTGHKYVILMTNVEMAGQLRNDYPTGNIHVYQCQTTGKLYCRHAHLWWDEKRSFKLIGEDFNATEQVVSQTPSAPQ